MTKRRHLFAGLLETVIRLKNKKSIIHFYSLFQFEQNLNLLAY